MAWFHAGRLSGGNKEIPEALKKKVYAGLVVGYRLEPNVCAAAYIKDAAAAVAWVFKNIAGLGVDTTKIFILGHSAGGNGQLYELGGYDHGMTDGGIPLLIQAIQRIESAKPFVLK